MIKTIATLDINFKKFITDILAITTKIDLLFIVADNSYHRCKADWYFYTPYIKSVSFVTFQHIGSSETFNKEIEDELKLKLSSLDFLQNLF